MQYGNWISCVSTMRFLIKSTDTFKLKILYIANNDDDEDHFQPNLMLAYRWNYWVTEAGE